MFIISICLVLYKFIQTLAGGQYEFEDGLFFGGLELQDGPRLMIDALKTLGLSRENSNLKQV